MLRPLISILLLSVTAAAFAAPPVYQEPETSRMDSLQAQSAKELQAADKYLTSPEFKKRLEAGQAAAGTIMPSSNNGEIKLPIDALAAKWAAVMNDAEQQAAKGDMPQSGPDISGVVVLGSLSIPKQTLKILAADASKAGGGVVFRGLKDDDFKAMRAELANMGEGFFIDPTLFQRFDIQEVPAIVLLLEGIKPCEPSGCPPVRHVKVTGNVTVEGALEFISRNSVEPGGRKAAEDILEKIRK